MPTERSIANGLKMRVIPLRRHGENVNPIYAATSGGAGWAGNSTDLERPDGQMSGIVKRFRKDEEASSTVTAIGLIKGMHGDAIEYTGIAAYVRGLIIFFGVFGACVGIGLGQMLLVDLIKRGLESTFEQVFAFFACVFIAIVCISCWPPSVWNCSGQKTSPSSSTESIEKSTACFVKCIPA